MTRVYRAVAPSALRGLWRFRLRSTLITLSAALGVAGVTVSAGYSEAGRQKVLSQLRQLGANIIVITPRPGRTAGGRERTGALATTLMPRDYNALRRDIDAVQAASATSSGRFLVKAGDLSKNNCSVLGTEAAYLDIRNWPLAAGQYFETDHDRRGARIAILGAVVARDLFGDESPLHRRVYINRLPFEVLGVLSERGQDLDGGDADNTIYVPLSTAMHRLANLDHYSGIVLSITNWERMNEVTAEVYRVLSRTHRHIGNEPVDFQILNQRTLIDTEALASKRLGRYVQAVGASALIVASLGILSIAWISVTERAGEIGLRRALGATKPDVFWQFTFEAAVLSTAGCAAGLLVSAVAMNILDSLLSAHDSFSWVTAGRAGAAALVLNLVFASLPSYRAATLDPIRALRPS